MVVSLEKGLIFIKLMEKLIFQNVMFLEKKSEP